MATTIRISDDGSEKLLDLKYEIQKNENIKVAKKRLVEIAVSGLEKEEVLDAVKGEE